MNDLFVGLLRHALTAFGMSLATKGLIDAGSVETVAGAVTTLASVGWMAWAKWAAAKAPPK